MNKIKLATCNCEECKIDDEKHSDNIIIPTSLPYQLNNIITLEEYITIATQCRDIINKPNITYKIIIFSFFISCLISLLFIKFHTIIPLIILPIVIISIISIGIVYSLSIIKSVQSLLDSKILELNSRFQNKGIRIEKSNKEYSDTTSKLIFINIYYNLSIPIETIIEIPQSSVKHKFNPNDEDGIIVKTRIQSEDKNNDMIKLMMIN